MLFHILKNILTSLQKDSTAENTKEILTRETRQRVKQHLQRMPSSSSVPGEVGPVQLLAGSRRPGPPPAAQHILQLVNKVLPARRRRKVLDFKHIGGGADNVVRVLVVHVTATVVGCRVRHGDERPKNNVDRGMFFSLYH